MLNVISVDIEEYFHTTEAQRFVGAESWGEMPSRVETATLRVMDLLAEHHVTGTFFVLGWVAQRYPRLVRSIAAAGHEIGCHGHFHRLVYELTASQFREDTEQAKHAIEDACGLTPRAYRAASYSITQECLWALDILAGAGFQYDSSIYPIAHDRYGIPSFGRHAQPVRTASGLILEVPIATVQLSSNRTTPVGGGAYLRLLPYRYTAAGVRRINDDEGHPACLYFHPWELDPEQPHVVRGLLSRLRMYGGVHRMELKLRRLLSEFRFSTLSAVYPV